GLPRGVPRNPAVAGATGQVERDRPRGAPRGCRRPHPAGLGRRRPTVSTRDSQACAPARVGLGAGGHQGGGSHAAGRETECLQSDRRALPRLLTWGPGPPVGTSTRARNTWRPPSSPSTGTSTRTLDIRPVPTAWPAGW